MSRFLAIKCVSCGQTVKRKPTNQGNSLFQFGYGLISHCAFSSNLFHGQIVQIAILQQSDPENKKGSP